MLPLKLMGVSYTINHKNWYHKIKLSHKETRYTRYILGNPHGVDNLANISWRITLVMTITTQVQFTTCPSSLGHTQNPKT